MIHKNIIKKESKNKKSSSSSTGSYTNESNEKYYVPASHQIKIIDFGGATYEDESHTEIINTRQYRAPEVILGKNSMFTKVLANGMKNLMYGQWHVFW